MDPDGVPASWYDGLTAVRHEGVARIEGSTLVLDDGSGAQAVPLGDLEYSETLREEIVLRRASLPDFRLRIPRDLPAELLSALPARAEYGRWVDRIGLGKAVVAFGIVSAAAVALFMTAPEWLGPRVPETWERRLGDAMIGDLGNRLCSTEFGDEALAKLLGKVDPGRPQVRAGIANIDMVNAVALPGGQVLLFDGLIQQAESPEELAGVLAHEVGHVRERHVMTSILRQFGLSVLLSGANSGIGNTAFGVASLGYTREAEREADAFARARMRESEISPLGAARFFERLGGGGGEGEGGESEGEAEPAFVGWLASHPSTTERAQAYRESAVEEKNYPPVLTEQEFGALKTMCEEDEDVEEFGL